MEQKFDSVFFMKLTAFFSFVEVAFVLLAVAFQAGCATDPDTGDVTLRVPAQVVDFVTNSIRGSATAVEDVDTGSDDVAEPPSSSGGEAKSPDLVFRYGGFKPKNPQEVAGCRIGSLKVGNDGLSYKWVAGGCENLGASSRDDYSQTVACAFFWDGNQWVGGKFDWISTSRTSRSFENIRDGYGGWDSTSFFAAKKHGFVIVSKDGKKRSNFIED